MTSVGNNEHRRTITISDDLVATVDIAVAVLVAAYTWEQSGPVRALCFAAGWAIAAHACVKILDVVLQNAWPHYEVHTLCATIWNDRHKQQIEAALRSDSPTHTLKALLPDAEVLAPFDSDDIYYSIDQMHEGAFLAAVDLWDPDKLNEDLLQTARAASRMTPVQAKIFEYRRLVANKILTKQIIAARRYRVKALNYDMFVSEVPITKQPMRLKSLALLLDNVQFDARNNWKVDVEFSSAGGRHYPALDYALLFGPQTSEGNNGPAYVTNCREQLLSDGDYTGVIVSDPTILMLLLKDRFWAAKSIVQGEQFIREVTPFIASEFTRLSTDVKCSSPECQAALSEVTNLLTR
jgi:hypothetical protein